MPAGGDGGGGGRTGQAWTGGPIRIPSILSQRCLARSRPSRTRQGSERTDGWGVGDTANHGWRGWTRSGAGGQGGDRPSAWCLSLAGGVALSQARERQKKKWVGLRRRASLLAQRAGGLSLGKPPIWDKVPRAPRQAREHRTQRSTWRRGAGMTNRQRQIRSWTATTATFLRGLRDPQRRVRSRFCSIRISPHTCDASTLRSSLCS